MRIIVATKFTGVDKATIVANDTTLLAPICFCLSNFISVDRAEISHIVHMNGRQNCPGNRVSPVNRPAHKKRP